MADYQVDVVIIGGGLSGATLLHALAGSSLRILMIDSQDFFEPQLTTQDARSLTLSLASLRILQHLDLWTGLAAHVTPIHTIHVSEQGRFGTACLEGPTQAPIGYVVPIHQLVQTLYQGLDRSQVWAPATVTAFDVEQRRVTVQKGTECHQVHARLVVAADGSHSSMRGLCNMPVQVKDYAQHAVVTQVDLARAHQHIAYERFSTWGPLALLPVAPKRMGVVWSLTPELAQQMVASSDREFLQALREAFGYRLGRFTGVGTRMTYPLRQMIMQTPVYADTVVFIGNAAHTLHPIAGQGFNLGLRDVAMLAQALKQADLSDPSLLAGYQAARQHDQTAIARLTDGLIALYSHHGLGTRISRQLGLLVLDNNRLLKRIVARYASGLAGIVPDLVCGIS